MADLQTPSAAPTFFAAAGRATGPDLDAQLAHALEDPCVQVVLEAVQGYLLILNRERQILAANRELLEALHRETPGCLIGLRPGEALNCVHFTEGPDGCGTALHCRTCGAVLAILASQAGPARVTEECRLSALENGKLIAREFRVTCSPLIAGDTRLTALVLTDISAEKRRAVLEQTFLHDILNSLGGLEEWSHMIGQSDSQTAAREILALADTLKDGIVSHRTLIEAEKGELVADRRPTAASAILDQLRSIFDAQAASQNRRLDTAPPPGDAILTTDPALLLRVLVNMVKNAFEATQPGAAIRVWFEWRDRRPTFLVHNPGAIPAAVQPHLFERSFSTKDGSGRGIGTYSMKLYGERYLGGSVSFSSTPDAGTSFFIALPPEPESAPEPATGSAPTRLAAGPPAPGAAPAGSILLVEDDEPLARLASVFLKHLGLEDVVICANGFAAEEAFKKSPESFAAVLTDANMPRMNGLQLGRKLLEVRPGVPIFLCTGAPDSDLAKAARGAGLRGVIAKPYSIPALEKALKPVLHPKL
jgi:signal transduction histidine kinase